jgi:hypothetical protein
MVKQGYGLQALYYGKQRFDVAIDSAGRYQVEGAWFGYDTPEKSFSLHETFESAVAQIRSEMVPLDEQHKYIYQEFPPEDAEEPAPEVAAMFGSDS